MFIQHLNVPTRVVIAIHALNRESGTKERETIPPLGESTTTTTTQLLGGEEEEERSLWTRACVTRPPLKSFSNSKHKFNEWAK